jgi:hypothetical protein
VERVIGPDAPAEALDDGALGGGLAGGNTLTFYRQR